MQSILNTITVFSVAVSIYFAFLFTLYCNPNVKLCISVYMIGDNSDTVSNGLISKNVYDTAVFIPDVYNEKEVITIGKKAFSASNIVIAYLSDNLTSIGNMAFQACRKLKTVYIRKKITKH